MGHGNTKIGSKRIITKLSGEMDELKLYEDMHGLFIYSFSQVMSH